ncbi:MAG: hypothetical protein DHS20C01_21160 [marine bacterium B5-7]|nr:MAG: hypothetical protein DHS20C01_21160 [marine bacterium B5-7]
MKRTVMSVAIAAILMTASGCVEQRQMGEAEQTDEVRDVSSQSVVMQPVVLPAVAPTEQQASQPASMNSVREERDQASAVSADMKTAIKAVPATLNATRQKSYAAESHIVGSLQPSLLPGYNMVDRENYAHYDDGGVFKVVDEPVSTFSIDVDSGSYANVRRLLNEGRLPPMDAVRAEELINYFDYQYPLADEDGEHSQQPFTVTTEVGPSPWNQQTRLLHIGIRGVDVAASETPPANLVFLVDVSGSMQSPDKIELLKSALKLLVAELNANDRISLVVYAGASGVVLEPVAGNMQAKIMNAIDSLAAGGSTNGGEGIRLAYRMARQAFIEGGINRILLATDGDFNVGTVNFDQLIDLVERERKSGVSLTTLGFGGGNYNDHLMEQLADAGNGNHAYIDTLNEARKVLVEQRQSTLNTIASDVKIQIEFNPDVVSEYRLIGYENRQLEREDFNNDSVDAGEIGAGHTVTALYEVSFVDDAGQRIDPLRYGRPASSRSGAGNDNVLANKDELAFLKIRYKTPGENRSELISKAIPVDMVTEDIAATTDRYRFSAAVAGFAQLLRGGRYLEGYTFTDVLELARDARGDDRFGYRGEFVSMVALAGSLDRVAQRSVSVQ